jgi:long-chain acyl-CoA synthetase
VYKNLAHMFFDRSSGRLAQPAVSFKDGRNGYTNLTWQQFQTMVEELGFGLASYGLAPGDSVAIFAQGSPNWIGADFATIINGGKSVPIYPTSSQSDIESILANSEAKFVFVQDEKLLKKVNAVRAQLPALQQVVLIKAMNSEGADKDRDGFITFEKLCEVGRDFATKQPSLLKDRAEQINLEDPATLIYTSGTTGTPKGAVITHKNILSVLAAIQPVLPISEADVYLSYLPLSHVFERICGEFYWAYSGGIYAFAESIETMAKNLGEVEPTMMLVVPRVLDRIYNKVKSGISGASPRAQKLIEWALEVGKEVVRAKSEGKDIRLALKLKHAISEKLVFRKLRERIGKRLRLVVSGGAPATPSAIEFFNAIGICCLEGYGLTETCAPSHVNLMNKVKIGTVGPQLPSVEMKIAEDGEILLRGPSIVQSYFRNDEASKEAFKDGWFHTGDIGTVDGDNFLRITDRKKDLIINSAGKNIAPQRIEAIIKSVPLVSQAVVFGDKQKALVALITLDEHAAIEYAREKNWEFNAFEDLVSNPEITNYLKKEIRLRSGQLADYEQVKKFRVLPQDLSVDSGELTATLKVKRPAISSRYAEIIQELYSEKASSGGDSELAKGRR